MHLLSGDTLRALIAQRGLNQSRLAAAAGCSASMINSLCTGGKTSCTAELAGRIAGALTVPVGVLFTPTRSRGTGSPVPADATLVAAS